MIERRRVQGGRPTPISEKAAAGRGPGAQSAPAAPERSASAGIDRSPESRQVRLEKFGGSPQTESAVEAGLGWLAAHQGPDGGWDRTDYATRCPRDDVCTGVAIRRTQPSLNPGLTGLALLAFLGAGHTDREGPYADVVQRAVDWLIAAQRPTGGFGLDENQSGYNDALATLALAEYSALTRDPRAEQPLRRAVTRLVASQQALGGWDYLPTAATGRNDTSITAWMVQALHAAAAAGVDVPRRTLVGAMLHLHRATEGDGRVWYADAGSGFSLDENMMPVYRYGPAMAAAGLMCTQMLGWRMDQPLLLREQALLLADPPNSARARGKDTTDLHSEYYWYYGTVAMFQRGGESWNRWNARLRDAILPLQNREKNREGQRRHAFGSWAPYGPNWGRWGRIGGRVYTTAICVLTLEIYYRNTPAYLKDDLLVSADDWTAYLTDRPPRDRREAVECLSRLRVEIGEPALVRALEDPDREVALAAAIALANLESPLGLKLLDDIATTLPPWTRAPVDEALQRARELSARPRPSGAVRRYSPDVRMATLDLPGSYVGLQVVIRREGRDVARMRVIQRFDGKSVAIAELLPGSTDAPREGDEVPGG